MLKHLLIAITLLTGCDGYHWFYACDDPNRPPNDQYCTTDGDGSPDGCPGDQSTFYVWYLGDDCLGASKAFCSDPDSAQAYADSLFGTTPHGQVSTDPTATAPLTKYSCGTGDDCVVGSSDESKATMFNVFSDDQIPGCEALIDSNCTWSPATDTPTCP
jgi:hypothetical protein